MIELVFGEIELPAPGADWTVELPKHAVSTRAALLRLGVMGPIASVRVTVAPNLATNR